MFDNLKAEMGRRDLTLVDFSKDEELNLSYETIRNKYSGRTEWTNREMWIIKNDFFPDCSIEYLFKKFE